MQPTASVPAQHGEIAVAPAGSPVVSVVLCTHDRAGYLGACLAGLAAQQNAPAHEVLVVDSASPLAGAARIASLAQRFDARLLVLDKPGLSRARNAGLMAAQGRLVAFIDDDAVAAPDWLAAMVKAALPGTVALGGRITPHYEAPLPAWWPPGPVAALTVIEHDRAGQVGHDLPRGVEPYGANMAFDTAALRAIGGFPEGLGRVGTRLLSGEESLVLRRLAASGGAIRYDPAVAVRHSIQANRLTPGWLVERLYWQGVSEVVLRRLLGNGASAWRAAPRRAAVALALLPLRLLPKASPLLIDWRWRQAYAQGFLRGLLRPPQTA
jgi:glycosyltransferase involved in cell wall biosynthesis